MIFEKNLFEEEVLLEGRDFLKNNQDDLYLMEAREIIHKKLQKMSTCTFKELENINLANLRQFWREVIEEYKKKNITDDDILDIIDCLESYIYGRYENKSLNDSEPLSIGKNAIQFIKNFIWFGNLAPEFIKVLQNYLQTPPGKEEEANLAMEKLSKRVEEKWREKTKRNPDIQHIITWEELEEG